MNNNYVFKALLPRIKVAQVNNAVDAADEGTLVGKFEAFDENTNGIKDWICIKSYGLLLQHRSANTKE